MGNLIWDYVIIGGGVAGCILANRLSADPANTVLLLEAGGKDSNPLIRAPGGLLPIMMSGAYVWPYQSAPQTHLDNRALYVPRGKILGGGSSVNGMVYDRGMHSDYDRWAQAGNAGWSFADVLPYFRRLETFHPVDDPWHGQDGPIQVSRPGIRHPFAKAFVEAGQQAGYPFAPDSNGADREGFGPVDITCFKGKRSSAASAYLAPARQRHNLKIETHALTTRLLFDGRRVIGVEYQKDGKVHQAKARNEVILCAGAINTPQLLMLSGIGPAEHVREHGIAVVHDLPGVGNNLQDHVAIGVRYRALTPLSHLRYLNPLHGAVALARYLFLKSGPLADSGMEAVAFVRSHPALEEPDLKLLLVMALFANNGRTLTPTHGFYAHINVARPESKGCVRLANADPASPPQIDQNYLSTENDRRVLREGVRIARRIFSQPAFDPHRGEELAPGPAVQSDAEIDAFIRSSAEADYHSVGTARMGSDTLAVVDAQLRVRGLDRLKIVDASIMPHLPGGNTAIPVAMIAEKAADMILGRAPLAAEHPGDPA